MPTGTTLMLGWLALLGTSLALFAVVAAAAWWQHRREVPRRSARLAERADRERHAVAAAGRAWQAERRVVAARERAEAAERMRAEAWQELDRAQQAHDEAVRRHADLVRQAGENGPDRAGQREVAQAALAAYRRGDLSGDQLWRVWQWGSGWDPARGRCEHELLRTRAARREAHLRYRAAAARERTALASAEVAGVEARALADEAATAAAEVAEVSG